MFQRPGIGKAEEEAWLLWTSPGSCGRVIVKTKLRSQMFLLVDEKAIQNLSNITFVINDFTPLG